MSVATDVLSAVAGGDRTGVASLLEPLNEAQRRAVREEIGDALRRHRPAPPAQWVAATLVRLGIATIGYVRRELVGDLGPHRPPLPCEDVVRVVRPRPAGFREKLPDALLALDWGGPWQLIRCLVRAGVCPPASDEGRWALALAAGVRFPLGEPDQRYARLEAALREDPELLEHDVWLLFRYEAAARANSGRYADSPPDANAWSVVLCRLADDGTLARDRLLDEALAGLERDLPASAVGFAQDVHRRLDPTADELVARSGTYVRLVSSPVPTTQGLALAACVEIHGAGRLPTDRFVEAARVPLQGAQKNVAMVALRVAEQMLDDAPDAALRTAIAGLQHARPDVQERSLALLESGGEHLNAQSRAELLDAFDVVAPTLRERVGRLAGIDTTGPPSPGIAEDLDVLGRRAATSHPGRARVLRLDDAVAAVAAGRWPSSPALVDDPMTLLGPAGDVVPIEDAEELVGVLAGLLEGVGTAVEAERALAGIATRARRSDVAALATLASPLRKRAAALLSDARSGLTLPGHKAAADWAELVSCWLDGRAPTRLAHDVEHPPLTGGRRSYAQLRRRLRTAARRPAVGPPSNVLDGARSVAWAVDDRAIPALAGFTALRMREVAHLAAEGQPATLAATPTHRQGWVEPGVLVARLVRATSDGPALRFDITQALHRLPPGDHPEARRSASDVPGAVGAALRRRLGAEEAVPDDGLADAASPPRTPPLRLVPGTVPMGYNVEIRQVVIAVPEPLRSPPAIDDPVRLVAHRLARPGYLPDVWWGGVAPPVHGTDELSARWHAIALPAQPELLAATVSLIVGALIDLDHPRLHPEPLLSAIVEPDQPFTWEAAQAVAACLLAKSATLRAKAADVLVATVDDGRIDPLWVGGHIAALVAIEVGVLTRCVDPLRDVASVSPTHAGVVFALLQQFVVDARGTPAGLHAPLGLLLELASTHRQRVQDPVVRARLGGWTGGTSKRATAAERLLAAEGDDRLITAAQRAVLAALIDRAR